MTRKGCTEVPLERTFQHLDPSGTFSQKLSALKVDLEVVSAELTELVNFYGRIEDSLRKLEPLEQEQ